MTLMKSIGLSILLALFALFAHPLQAHKFEANGIEVDHPWARPTPPVQPINSAVYLTVYNRRDTDIHLIGASTSISEHVSLHRSQTENGMMTMRPLPDGLVVEAGKTAVFEPGGLHIMLKDLDQPLQEGDRFPLALSFENGEVVELEVYIERGAAEKLEGHDH